MIEKFKNYLYIDDYKRDESTAFSIIETRPRLVWKGTEEDDMEFAIDNNKNFVIIARSLEAQDDLMSYLIAAGFDDVEKLTDCKEGTGNHMKSDGTGFWRFRRYYNIDQAEGIEKYLLSNSRLAVKVKIDKIPEDISKLREVLYDLRKNKSYRNIWKTKERKCVVIG